MENLNVLKFYVAKFNYDLDDYEQESVSLSLDNARLRLAKKRKDKPLDQFVIIAVLDE
nr:MAG TPA: hypothetical protein [Caudoviricetes sp.]